MKIHKKMLVAGLMLIMLLAISGCGRKNIKIALYQYTENEDGTLTITALTDKGRSEDELVVPAVLDGKSVSTIGDGAGSAWSLLSSVIATYAKPTGLRFCVPANMTSSIFAPRSCFALCSPRTHLTASATLLFPEPLGPTMPVIPL